MNFDRLLKIVGVLCTSTAITSAVAKWPLAITILTIVGAVVSALMADGPIDHAAIAVRKADADAGKEQP